MPSLKFESRPYGTAVNITNHYTGWVAIQIAKVTSDLTQRKMTQFLHGELLVTPILEPMTRQKQRRQPVHDHDFTATTAALTLEVKVNISRKIIKI
ncbi:hypothetical protein TNCV_1792211 [Trichonephila clavipes]|nr:hypothetical protein TNCV_1792211 [Trichonephila clavipes]